MNVVVVFDNIRSALNVGAIFRTADALGVDKVYLCGTSSVPVPSTSLGTSPSTSLPRQARDSVGASKAGRELAKTALGAENYVSWEYHKRTSDVLRRLKKQGFQIVALEQAKEAVEIRSYKPLAIGKVALILGYEVKGISKHVLSKCDKIVYIPMFGKKESLNVAVAFGVAGYLLKFKTQRSKGKI